MRENDFGGLRILALESRRENEVANLIRNAGGVPTVIPVLREVPIESNQDAITFAQALLDSKFNLVIFLTGVGARILFNSALTRFAKDDLHAALSRTTTLVRGPKAAAALRDFGVTPKIASPSPSTWHEVLASIDTAYPNGLQKLRVAVQEYGAPDEPLMDGLRKRGATVTAVRVYQWALPENLDQIRATVESLTGSHYDVALFLSGVQAQHLLEVAEQMHRRDAVLEAFKRMLVASIGPDTSAELQRQGIAPDFQPSQPKMGFLISELAKVAPRLLQAKRAGSETSFS